MIDLSSSPEVWSEALYRGDRAALARLLTLAESSLESHQELVDQVLTTSARVYPQASSLRIAITGAPGVGKSTLLESLGTLFVEQGLCVAVLTIDPTSPVSGGSLLADKTRMPRLSALSRAFIRPIPQGRTLGGVSYRTRQCLDLCEHSGFDVVFVETVGVGQSELDAWALVDCFLALVAPAAGDEIQGMKRGLMEQVDVLAITKSALFPAAAEETRDNYVSALSLLRSTGSPEVFLVDSLSGLGISSLGERLRKFSNVGTSSSALDFELKARRRQARDERDLWNEMTRFLKERVEGALEREDSLPLAQIMRAQRAGEISVRTAVRQIFELFPFGE